MIEQNVPAKKVNKTQTDAGNHIIICNLQVFSDL